MNDQKDMSPLERTILLAASRERELSRPAPIESKGFMNGSTVAQDMLREAHPDLSDEALNRLAQEL